MKWVQQIVLLILGAVVLVGCQKPQNNEERPRYAGEIETVSTTRGLMRLGCVQAVSGSIEDPTSADYDQCIVKGAVDTETNAGEVARKRMFYGYDTYNYLYLPYYYSQGNDSNALCKRVFGRNCWRNDWYTYYFGYNYNTYNQYYNPSCYQWINYNYTTTTSYYTSPMYYDPSQNYSPSQIYNSQWYGCYNVWY